MAWAVAVAVAATVALMALGESINADGSVPPTKEMVKLILFPDVTSSPQALEAALLDLARLPAKGQAGVHGTPRKRARVALPAAVITTGSLTTRGDAVDQFRSHVSQLARFAEHVTGVDVAAVISPQDVEAVGAQVAENELARLPHSGGVATTDAAADRFLELGVGYCAIVLSHADASARSAQLRWVEKHLSMASEAKRSCIVLAPDVRPLNGLTEMLVRHYRDVLAVIQTTGAGTGVAIRRLPVDTGAEGQRDGCLSIIELPATLSTPEGECRAAPIVKLFLRKPTLLLTPVGENRSQTVMLDTATCSFHRNESRPPLPPLCHSVLDRRSGDGARQFSAKSASAGDSSVAPTDEPSEAPASTTVHDAAELPTTVRVSTPQGANESSAESDEPAATATTIASTSTRASSVAGGPSDTTNVTDNVRGGGDLNTTSLEKRSAHDGGVSDEPRTSHMTTHKTTEASDETANTDEAATTPSRKTRGRVGVDTTVAPLDAEETARNISTASVPRRRHNVTSQPAATLPAEDIEDTTTTKVAKRKRKIQTTAASEQEAADEPSATPTALGRHVNDTGDVAEPDTETPHDVPPTKLRSKAPRRTAAPTPVAGEAGSADDETPRHASSRGPRATPPVAGSEDADEPTTQPPTSRIKRRKPKSTAAAPAAAIGDEDDHPVTSRPTGAQQTSVPAAMKPSDTAGNGDEATSKDVSSEVPASTQQRDQVAALTTADESPASDSPPPPPPTADSLTTVEVSDEPTTKTPVVQPPAPAEDASTQFVNLFNILIATLIVVPSLAMVARVGAWLGVSSDQIKGFAGNHALSPALRAVVDVVGLVISCASVLFVFGSFVYNKWRQSRRNATSEDGERAGMTSGAAPGSDTESAESMKSASAAPPVPKTVTIGKPKRKGAASTAEPKRPVVKGIGRRSKSPDRAAAAPIRGAVAIPVVAPRADRQSPESAGAPSDNADGSTRNNSKGASEDGWESDW